MADLLPDSTPSSPSAPALPPPHPNVAALAVEGVDARPPGSPGLLRRFRQNAARIVRAYRALSEFARRREPIPPVSDWLLDNFYVVEDVLRQTRQHLPASYFRELPALRRGKSAGLPRVYLLAEAVLDKASTAIAEADVLSAVTAYQQTATLTIGEVWAVPTMLRLAALDTIRRVADDIMATHAEGVKALTAAASGRPDRLPAKPTDAFTSAVWDALRDDAVTFGTAADAWADWLAEHLGDPQEVVHREHTRLAAAQLELGNAVVTLRLLDVIDWKAFFERVSAVEAVLRTDPGGTYPRQDFATRDQCRRAVEELAKGSGRGEEDVARAAVAVARKGGTDPLRNQVTAVLVGAGRKAFADALGYRPRWGTLRATWATSLPHAVYFGALAVFTLVVVALAVMAAVLTGGTVGAWALVGVAAVAFLPALDLAVAFTQVLVRRLVPPRVLPKLDWEGTIPDEFATFVVVPTLVGKPEQAGELLERLELHHLSNPEPALRFALLTDFPDAATETTLADAACLAALTDGVKRLNERHAADGPPRFFVFHRRRTFDRTQQCWMGWERKRGKLDEFNRLLRGSTDTSYTTAFPAPDADELKRVRYVLTLDTDTVLPRDAARHMVATLAHPLNRPRFSADGRRVEGGYAILQPRVSFLYRTGFRSWFARLFAGSVGVDPYSSASSDTYMDLFAKGSFTGKGLYDVDAFERAVGRAFPDDSILSHDLIESDYARCGLATDIEVYDDFPARYHAYARREHRWVRGDWQLLPWLGPTVPTPDGRQPNVLPALERWKIVDNLRRSVTPAALVLLLALGWTVLPGAAWVWTLLALAPLLFPVVQLACAELLGLFHGVAPRAIAAKAGFTLGNTAGQAVLRAALLVDQAVLATDAILRTLFRLFVSRTKLLEWESAAATDQRLDNSLRSFLRPMGAGVGIAAAVAVLVAVLNPAALWAAGWVLLAWLAAPLVAYLVSRPRTIAEPPLAEADRDELRRVARRIWDFFETFVTAGEHWLPPDNFQESPLGVVAHRTSPTNVGLYLLSAQAAHDFGYVTTGEMADRLDKTLGTIETLEKNHGHLLNWYETTTLAVLPPAYVSTVDSGNLLGCLMALDSGLRTLARTPNAGLAAEGAADTLGVLKEELARIPNPPSVAAVEEAVRAADWEKVRAAAGGVADALPEGSAARRWAEHVIWAAEQRLAAPRPDATLAATLTALADRAAALAAAMDFRFLYNPDRELFPIGFNAATGKFDANYYDLLASEACIASFLTVARGEVPRKHWFRLGRLATRTAGDVGLVSWGGTMFEYLMPRLLLPAPKGVLLDRAQRSAVARQVEYGRERKLPWGVSESGFAATDAGQVYQYQSFGVPGLGLKRGLDKDRVVAPYATLMAADVDPAEAVRNLARLRALGGEGEYGYFEALDFTDGRVPDGKQCAVVQSYMAHHQGMAFLAVANRLTGGVVRKRLQGVPCVRAAELLLEERVPYDAPDAHAEEPPNADDWHTPAAGQTSRRRLTTPDTPTPRTHLLSNGRYAVMVTNAGGGSSRWKGLAVTRWLADPTLDPFGLFVYVRDRDRGTHWSVGYQPTLRRPAAYEVTYAIDKAEFRRVDDDIETVMEVAVAPDQDLEVRRVTVRNLGGEARTLDLTSYAEPVLDTPAADLAHPAFGKLFLETEWLPDASAILCHRRTRSPEDAPVWAFHAVVCVDPADGVSWDTDRAGLLGRRRTPASPAMLDPACGALPGRGGAVLDPAFAVRKALTLAPEQAVTVSFVTGVASTRDDAAAMAHRHRAPQAVARVFELAWAHARIELQHAQRTAEEVHLYQRLAGHLLYPNAALRADEAVLAANRQPQAEVWRFGISGDWPIAVLRLHGPDGIPTMRRLLAAHAFWTDHGLKADLLVLLENVGGYVDELFTEASNVARAVVPQDRQDKPGGVFVRKGWQASETDRTLLLAIARVVLDDRGGPLEGQAEAVAAPRPLPSRTPKKAKASARPDHAAVRGNGNGNGKKTGNGYGRFTDDGRAYVTAASAVPPVAWANVIANPAAGFIVTDSGGGFAWVGNSQANRLTPWSNDPVSDPPGDAFYLQDEATQAVWSPTPLPAGGGAPVEVRHAAGCTTFESVRDGLYQELTVFVPAADPVKVSVLKLRNDGPTVRTVVVAYYVEWVVGTTREATAQHLVTETDAETGAVFARNPFLNGTDPRVAFAATDLRPRTVTGDRGEFLGRNGRYASPAAFERTALSGKVGAGLDPCGAIRGTVTLAPGEERAVVCLLGQAATPSEARKLVRAYGTPAAADAALRQAVAGWDRRCDTVAVSTPDAAFDVMMNRWLPYQALSCRVWGRSAVYQSGGAFGFRDQLQDVCALVHAVPKLARDQIMKSASRQFVEGDVQHWWHEPSGAGVRTQISDDFLWLPYAACHYAAVTGDVGVWDEPARYLTGNPLPPDKHESYEVPTVSEQTGTLYEHCLKAVWHGYRLGEHGLPLMGCGDWNDGMNRVGVGGKGESVWLAWFLVHVLDRFAPVADRRGDATVGDQCRTRAAALRAAVDRHAWDGAWYRRAYFDDGTPLGSAQNDECRIDSLSQSWAVIAGGADPARASQGMDEVEKQLMLPTDRLIRLFTPPFDSGPLQPGYIKGYVPGVRENGGQYTHAATWVVKALAAAGRGDDAHAAFDRINPASTTATPEGVERYKGEPYAVAADVYAHPQHVGRAGWTWYTGSAGWLYRVGLEDVLGVHREGAKLRLDPCIPAGWGKFTVKYRFGDTVYAVEVSNPRKVHRGVKSVTVDGAVMADGWIELQDDRKEHRVQIELG